MKIINLFGSSGAGKTTTALGLTYHLKLLGFKCEYVSEYAKELVFLNKTHIFQDQLHVYYMQKEKIDCILNSNLDFIITDSPILLSCFYGRKYQTLSTNLQENVQRDFNTYNNINFFLHRMNSFDPFGRIQTEKESDKDSTDLYQMLLDLRIPFESCESNNSLVSQIINKLTKKVIHHE
jgi:deoxyadenosine/deoxycytidine kinase